MTAEERANLAVPGLFNGRVVAAERPVVMQRVAEQIREAVAEEREACAKLVEGFRTNHPPGTISFWGEGLAEAIHNRKEQS